MENTSIHYDGSVQSVQSTLESQMNSETVSNDFLEFTDELRKNIGSNPYVIE